MTYQLTNSRNRFGALCGLLLLCLICAGCEAPGFIAYVVGGPPKMKARFTLEEQSTLVIVDDPSNMLGDPNNATVIAANVGFHLKENDVLLPELVVPQDHLTVLAANMGDRYLATPIDQIGRRLKADQVIHVQIREVSLQSANTYYEPSAEVEVKIIDTQTGKRLFPISEDKVPGISVPGETLMIEMKRQTLDETRRNAIQMMARDLAERIGLEVAGLFYDHVPPDDIPDV